MKIEFTDFQKEFNLYKKDIVNSINKVDRVVNMFLVVN